VYDFIDEFVYIKITVNKHALFFIARGSDLLCAMHFDLMNYMRLQSMIAMTQ
jgi:hypothetical protein